MKALAEPTQNLQDPLGQPNSDGNRAAVLRELDNILSSSFFKSASRCKQFLSYVVLNKLEGRTEQLKERTIGTEVFHRLPGYATGDDPVVRVQAGEVRRRLEQYYRGSPHPDLRIELPVGSYSPIFHWESREDPKTLDSATDQGVAESSPPVENPRRSPLIRLSLLAAAVLLVILVAAFFLLPHRSRRAGGALEEFWDPVFSNQQPVLICLAKPVAYRPNEDIYRRYSRNHPGTFQTEDERTNQPLPLDPDEQLTWGDFFVYTDYGVAAGDVYAAVALSRLFGKLDKPAQLRIGSAYTYQDLRDFPAAVIGGFNNKWTMQLTANQHFALIEDHEKYMIREQLPGGRVWKTRLGPNGETLEDFAIVSRLVNSKTGQFTVTVAGIGPKGTQAAGELVSTSRYLQEGLSSAPANWQAHNLELLLETTVTDSVAGPPHVIATYVW